MAISRRPAVDLERVVRPFTIVRGKPDRDRNAAAYGGGTASSGAYQDTDGNDLPTLEWSATAQVVVTTLEGQGFITQESRTNEEVSRETFTQRVFDPDDSTVFVDVEKVAAVTFKDKLGRKSSFSYSD